MILKLQIIVMALEREQVVNVTLSNLASTLKRQLLSFMNRKNDNNISIQLIEFLK